MKKTRVKQVVALSLSASLLITGFTTVARVQAESSDDQTESSASQEVSLSPLAESLETALELFGEEFPEAELTEIDIDLEKEGHYDIQLHGQDSEHDYELEYDTEKAAVTDLETDRDKDKERALPLDELLSVDEISELALAEAGFGQITEWNLEWEDDSDDSAQLYWEIQIEEADSDREVTIDIEALTGEILNVEHDD